ncbi:MAG: SH3 domain-containing protein [Anaerolineae bacterium]|nr:SH3 domain-containing protein [Anaerolineae bacterium]
MKARYWSLAIVLVLINYLIFATLFSWLVETDFEGQFATRTPVPTFTPAPAEPFIIVPTFTPAPVIPTPTATRVLSNGEPSSQAAPGSGSEAAGQAPAPKPQVIAPGAVNIRSGPGLDFEVIGTLNANAARPITGRTGDASWWQIKVGDDQRGWVSGSVVQASETGSVPVIDSASAAAPASAPAVQPAASNPPPAPAQPKYQFTPTGWYDDGNAGLTRFMGEIKDVNGSPVNGVYVRASCGNYSTISYPSGPTPWGPRAESADWPPGFYDITVDTRPVPCVWILSVVETDATRETVTAVLSEAIPVEVTTEKSIIVAGWQKNF